jgi:50S ribosomal subunit-associated GTPase HflX
MRTDGLAALKKSLRALARKERPVVHVRVPTADGARLAEMYRVGEVLDRHSEDGTEELTVRLEDWQAERLEREGVEVRRGDDRQRSRATG